MSREPLTASIKTRVPQGMKDRLDHFANKRHLDLADIAREALRSYIEREEAEEAAKQNQAVVA